MTVDPSYGLQQELRPKRERWGGWATVGWGAVIAVAHFLTQMIAALGFVLWWTTAFPGAPIDPTTNGPLLSVVTLFSTAAIVGVVFLAVRLSRVPAAEYLALKWPSRRNLLIGLLTVAIMLPLADYITVQSGEDVIPEFMTDIYVSSQDAGTFFAILLTITLIVLAPLGEEILFRGFLFRGLNAGLGPAGAVLLTALTWAALHVQYNWLFMAQILFFGIVLGWIRLRSGSLLLVMLLHAIINLLALVQVSVMLGA
jgi:hypothetical protein